MQWTLTSYLYRMCVRLIVLSNCNGGRARLGLERFIAEGRSEITFTLGVSATWMSPPNAT
jgi:hypothetical protein